MASSWPFRHHFVDERNDDSLSVLRQTFSDFPTKKVNINFFIYIIIIIIIIIKKKNNKKKKKKIIIIIIIIKIIINIHYHPSDSLSIHA